MTDSITRLASLNRPRLLIRAARAGLPGYERTRDLGRHPARTGPRGSGPVRWMPFSTWKPGSRRAAAHRTRAMTSGRHIEVLIALMAEAGQMPSTRGSAALAVAAE